MINHILAGLLLTVIVLTGCDSASEDPFAGSSVNTNLVVKALDISLFNTDAFIDRPAIVDCNTNSGTQTTCYKLVSAGGPSGRKPGNFCPINISDSADVSGAWFSKEGKGDLVDLTGEFIANISAYYDDADWKLHDPETGKIRYTSTKAACLGAAQPNVEDQYQQNCIECKMEYLDSDFSRTYLIPTTPIPSTKLERVRTVGIALDGAELSGPAPVDAILENYTIAAFDDCGGHINEHQGYHYHSTTGCTDKPNSSDGYAPLIGYAADGFAIYALKDANGNKPKPESLDKCRGTSDTERGYHYRAASPSENMMIGCLRGETVRPAGFWW